LPGVIYRHAATGSNNRRPGLSRPHPGWCCLRPSCTITIWL